MRIRLAPSGKFASVVETSAVASGYSAGWSTASGAVALPTNDTAVVLPTAPFFSFVTYAASSDWDQPSGFAFRCLRAGRWRLSFAASFAKTTAAQAAMFLIGDPALAGTSIFQPSLPLTFMNLQTAAMPVIVERTVDLTLNQQVVLLGQRQTAAAGNVTTLGPIIFSATPARGLVFVP